MGFKHDQKYLSPSVKKSAEVGTIKPVSFAGDWT
jgi:hypothetical protein